jgi:rhamnosyltransferase
MQQGASVGAVIVTYRPDRVKLEALLRAIHTQVGVIAIVDNTESSRAAADASVLELAQQYDAECIQLGENRGIAAAQNAGVQRFNSKPELEYVLFLDHDSLPGVAMVESLVEGFRMQTAAGYRVGAVGPQIMLPKIGMQIPFLQISWLRTKRIACHFPAEQIKTDHLISSGTLTSKAVLRDVGIFREDLFIDYVDVEWYLRAIEQNYTLWGICAATMEHDLGDEPITVGGHQIFSHSPLRHYYMVRNAIALYKSPLIPLRWKCSDMPRLFLKSMFYVLFGKPRLAQMRMMGKGMIDGFAGRMGQLQDR